jgi:hypothetical protein
MKHALAKAFESAIDEQRTERGVDRILEAAFFRRRPLQAGSTPVVVDLFDRRPRPEPRR